jgi:hypothetical protein
MRFFGSMLAVLISFGSTRFAFFRAITISPIKSNTYA